MSSSISSFDPTRSWRRFAATLLVTALAVLGVLYAFVIVIDPWDTLPLSPPLPRVPISSNARFSHPALARSPRFDSAVFGTSTARLLQPAHLNPLFDARFVNLAMNSATAWEQVQLMTVFLRAHPHPRAVIMDMDAAWCGASPDRLTPRPFPDWMYRANRWPAYRYMLTPYAVQEAANQLGVMLGLKRRRYGLDGYTSFVPPDSAYDPVRVAAAFARWDPTDETPALPGDTFVMPNLTMLEPVLRAIPSRTRVILFFPPTHIEQHGHPGSRTAARWALCKDRVAEIARRTGAEVLDFMRATPITTDRAHYWDPLHYRADVAARIAARLGGRDGPAAVRLVP